MLLTVGIKWTHKAYCIQWTYKTNSYPLSIHNQYTERHCNERYTAGMMNMMQWFESLHVAIVGNIAVNKLVVNDA